MMDDKYQLWAVEKMRKISESLNLDPDTGRPIPQLGQAMKKCLNCQMSRLVATGKQGVEYKLFCGSTEGTCQYEELVQIRKGFDSGEDPTEI